MTTLSLRQRIPRDRRRADARSLALLTCLLAASLGDACAPVKVSPNAKQLRIAFEWTEENRCSRRSPAIEVTGVPAAAVRLEVTLRDLDMPQGVHGGGIVTRWSDGVIPAGALYDFRGPCPPGPAHRYALRVRAIDAEGVVIAHGEAVRPCCQF